MSYSSGEYARFVICPCQICSGAIEFDANELKGRKTATVECPHCKMETIIFPPHSPKGAPPEPSLEPDEIVPYIGKNPLKPRCATPSDIRKKNIEHEASVRGIALLYGFISAIFGVFGLVILVVLRMSDSQSALSWLIPTSVLLVAALFAVLAWGIRRLKPWSQIAASVLACFGLLGFPFGTLINGYILYLLNSEKGKLVFSPEYVFIIEQTPEVRYKTPLYIWIALGLVVLLFLIGMIVGAWTTDWTAHVK
jgi:hypothetical protein